jgi:hypothetical protein
MLATPHCEPARRRRQRRTDRRMERGVKSAGPRCSGDRHIVVPFGAAALQAAAAGERARHRLRCGASAIESRAVGAQGAVLALTSATHARRGAGGGGGAPAAARLGEADASAADLPTGRDLLLSRRTCSSARLSRRWLICGARCAPAARAFVLAHASDNQGDALPARLAPRSASRRCDPTHAPGPPAFADETPARGPPTRFGAEAGPARRAFVHLGATAAPAAESACSVGPASLAPRPAWATPDHRRRCRARARGSGGPDGEGRFGLVVLGIHHRAHYPGAVWPRRAGTTIAHGRHDPACRRPGRHPRPDCAQPAQCRLRGHRRRRRGSGAGAPDRGPRRAADPRSDDAGPGRARGAAAGAARARRA